MTRFALLLAASAVFLRADVAFMQPALAQPLQAQPLQAQPLQAQPLQAQPLQAVVPTRVVHPGETITLADLRVVAVRNPNPVREPVVRRMEEALGRVSRRTLLPRRYIARASLRVPHAVGAGETVTLRLRAGALLITARGTALASAAPGESVAVRTPRGRTVFGRAVAGGTVEVTR